MSMLVAAWFVLCFLGDIAAFKTMLLMHSGKNKKENTRTIPKKRKADKCTEKARAQSEETSNNLFKYVYNCETPSYFQHISIALPRAQLL